MRYSTREYQSDSSSLPLGRSADWIPTSCTPGWRDTPGVHSECYRRTTTRTTKSLDTGLSISVLRRALDGVDDEYIDGAALRVELQSELFLQRRID